MNKLAGTIKLWLSVLAAAGAIIGLIQAFPDYKVGVGLGVTALWLILVGRIIVRHFWAQLAVHPKKAEEPVRTPLTFADVEYAIRALGDKLRRGGFIPDVIIGIDRGGAIVAGWLGKKLGKPAFHISSSNKWTVSTRQGSLDDGIKDPRKRGEQYKAITKVLVTDDASRTGETLKVALECLGHLISLSEAEIKTAVILNEEHMAGPSGGKTLPDFFIYRTVALNITFPWDRTVLE